MNALSASRIKLAKQCSWQYWCKYKLKLPDTSNDGASRGWIVHLVLELMAHPKREKFLKKVIKDNSVLTSPSLERLVLHHAKRLNVDDDENLELIDQMTMAGLNYDFKGDTNQKPVKALDEQKFDITVEDNGVAYRVLGFIDKLFIYKDGSALIRDFKTSKQVFKGSDITDNLQNLIYSLATKHMFPEVKNVNCEFLFLKFPLEKDLLGNPGKGTLRLDEVSEDELEGFQHQLTAAQNYLDNFNDMTALSSLAAVKGYPSDGTFGGPLVCGREGYKKYKGEEILDKDGNKIPNYICPFRRPMDYYVLLNKDKKIIKSAFESEADTLIPNEAEGETVELRHYEGCPHWNKKEVDEFDL
jgi:hypothetical protein